MFSISTVVLAAGAGRRLASVTGGTPKQFWSHDGVHSLVEQTVARLGGLSSPRRTVTVIDRSQHSYVARLSDPDSLGRLVPQPCDRGTAVGALLGIAVASAADPDDIVLLSPADHGVSRPGLFQLGIREASLAVRTRRTDIVLFGVEPDQAHSDYGWILPDDGRANGRRVQLAPVAAFVEKPSLEAASGLLAAGAVWNTMVLVARAGAVLDLYRRYLPELADIFNHAWTLPPDHRETFLEELYPLLPTADFSHDVLTPAEGLVLYTWPASLGWSDLGTPERLERWLGLGERAAPVADEAASYLAPSVA